MQALLNDRHREEDHHTKRMAEHVAYIFETGSMGLTKLHVCAHMLTYVHTYMCSSVITIYFYLPSHLDTHSAANTITCLNSLDLRDLSPLSSTFRIVKLLWLCLRHCSSAVKRPHDQGNSYKKKSFK